MLMKAGSPCGAIFMTDLSANSIFNSASFFPQVPDKDGFSSFLSSARLVKLNVANTPHANSSTQLNDLENMTLFPPSLAAHRTRRYQACRGRLVSEHQSSVEYISECSLMYQALSRKKRK